MSELTLPWTVTLLLVHFTACLCLVSVVTGAPCFLQRLAVVMLIVALGSHALSYGFQLFEETSYTGRVLWRLSLALEHLGVLLYVFRLWYREKVDWRPISAGRRRGDKDAEKWTSAPSSRP